MSREHRFEPEPDDIWRQINHYVKWTRARAICVAMASIKETMPEDTRGIVEPDLKRLRDELHAMMQSGIVI